jgi:hypothetical protein
MNNYSGVACEVQVSNTRVIELFEDAQGMAERLGLFGGKSYRRNAADWQVLSAQVKRQTAQVAWGAYNWLSYVCLVLVVSCRLIISLTGAIYITCQSSRFHALLRSQFLEKTLIKLVKSS